MQIPSMLIPNDPDAFGDPFMVRGLENTLVVLVLLLIIGGIVDLACRKWDKGNVMGQVMMLCGGGGLFVILLFYAANVISTALFK